MAHEPTNIFGYRVLPTGEPRARRVGIGVRAPWMLASNDPSFVPMEHSVPRTEDLTPQRRREIANAQIDMFVQEIRRRHPGFNLDADVRERALGIAERMHTGGVDSLVREVMATANASLPSNIDQLDLNARLQGLNITPQEYYAALSRFGASGYGDIAALIAAYRAAQARGELGTGSSLYGTSVTSYPGYGGTAFTSESSAYAYNSANYGLSRHVSDQLYGLGVRSTAQVQQVIRDVDQVGDGITRRLGGGHLSEAERRRLRNDTAVPTARLRALAGERMPQYQAHTEEYVATNTRLQIERDRALAAGNSALVAELDAQIRANEARAAERRNQISATAPAGRREAERRAAEERDRAAARSILGIVRANPALVNNLDALTARVDRRVVAQQTAVADEREAQITTHGRPVHVIAARTDEVDTFLGVTPAVATVAATNPTGGAQQTRTADASPVHPTGAPSGAPTNAPTSTSARVHTANASQATPQPPRRQPGATV